jgi:hypothetical protein
MGRNLLKIMALLLPFSLPEMVPGRKQFVKRFGWSFSLAHPAD